MAIIIKGQDSHVKDGVEQVYATRADIAFNSIVSRTNKLALSELKTLGLKDQKTNEFVNRPVYPEGTKLVVKKDAKGKEVTRTITPDKTLSSIEFTKTSYYNNKEKKFVKLNKPIDMFTVNPTVEGLLQLSFPAYLSNGKLEYTVGNETKTKDKFMEYTLPKNYDTFTRLTAENIKAIAGNIAIDGAKELRDAKIAAADSPEKDVYVEKPQVKKNVARLYAMLEEYPNILPLLPAYVVALPIVQEAYLKGKANEGLLDMDNKLQFVKLYDSDTKTSTPIFDKIKDVVKSNALSKDKFSTLISNTIDEVGKTDIKFDDIKAEYAEAKASIEEMKKLDTYQVREKSKGRDEISVNQFDEVYGETEGLEETRSEAEQLADEVIEDVEELDELSDIWEEDKTQSGPVM